MRPKTDGMKEENLEGRRTMIQKEIVTGMLTQSNNSLTINHTGGQDKRTTRTYTIIGLGIKIARFIIRHCYSIRSQISREDKGYGDDKYDVQAGDE